MTAAGRNTAGDQTLAHAQNAAAQQPRFVSSKRDSVQTDGGDGNNHVIRKRRPK
jgi:hypothetical protein